MNPSPTKSVRELLSIWYELIGDDHHKDRDCHFFIQKRYCAYKDEPAYEIVHYGYLVDDKDISEWTHRQYETSGKAEFALREMLAFMICKVWRWKKEQDADDAEFKRLGEFPGMKDGESSESFLERLTREPPSI